MAKLQAIRGMNDILPAQTSTWQALEAAFHRVVNRFGYQEIRFPVLEQTQLFKRSIGEVTDIVEKEMYSFDDRNGDNLSLRPEGTAGCSILAMFESSGTNTRRDMAIRSHKVCLGVWAVGV